VRVICSYCGILYDLKEPFEDDSVSHGVCEECWPWVEHNLNAELARPDFSDSKNPPPAQEGLRPGGITAIDSRKPFKAERLESISDPKG